jgi:hypothetical protein
VVVAEWKAGQDAETFQRVTNDQADDDEDQDAAPAVAQRAVNERERHRNQHQDGRGNRVGNEPAIDQREHAKERDQPPEHPA